MGAQIAQALAMRGVDVTCFDLSDDSLRTAPERVSASLDKHFVQRDKLTREEADAVLGRLTFSPLDGETSTSPQVVLEAVAEKTDAKQAVFRWAEERVPDGVTIATNTSGISVTEIASVLRDRDRSAGFHFFNPVLVMRLVEIVRTEWTSQATIETLRGLAAQLGKTPIVCADVEAFVANRCYEGLLREAFWLAFEDVAAPWDVDTAMKLGYNMPIGPLELQDRIGTWNLLRSEEQQDRLLRSLSSDGRAKVNDMIDRGFLGRLEDGSNRGIYEYFQEVLGHERQGDPS